MEAAPFHEEEFNVLLGEYPDLQTSLRSRQDAGRGQVTYHPTRKTRKLRNVVHQEQLVGAATEYHRHINSKDRC
jgi:hypothetical protein